MWRFRRKKECTKNECTPYEKWLKFQEFVERHEGVTFIITPHGGDDSSIHTTPKPSQDKSRG